MDIVSKCLVVLLIAHNVALTPSTSTTVIAGQEFTLYCKFVTASRCFWQYNYQRVSLLQHRLTLVSSSTNDLSIRMRNAQKQDEGQWECTCRHGGLFFHYVTHNKTRVTVLLSERDLFDLQPQNATVTLGESFLLSCTLTLNGFCTWYQNGFAKQLPEYQSKDLTFKVAKSAKSHEGRWQCVCRFSESSFPVIKSNEAWVTVVSPKKSQNESQQLTPRRVTIPAGDDFVLHCTFTKSLYCLWQHNGTFVNPLSHSRVSFLTSSGWSLNIHEAEQRDQGQWECSCTLNSSSFLVYNTTLVTIQTGESAMSSLLTIVENPENVIVTEGQSFSLTAVFNHEVFCSWRHFTNPWLITRTDVSSSTTNCTLIIENARPTHEGTWKAVGLKMKDDVVGKESYPVVVIVVNPIPVNVLKLIETTPSSTHNASVNENVPSTLHTLPFSPNTVSPNQNVSSILDTLPSSPTTVSPNNTVSMTMEVSPIQTSLPPINSTYDVITNSSYQKQMLFHEREGNYSTTTIFLISSTIILGCTTIGFIIYVYKKREVLFGAHRKDIPSYEVTLLNAESEISIIPPDTDAN